MAENLALPPDWSSQDSEEDRKAFEFELQRELCPDHVLHGFQVTALARRQSRDDFLFHLDDGRFALVHLTWQRETNPTWPATALYDTFAEWKSDADEEWEGEADEDR